MRLSVITGLIVITSTVLRVRVASCQNQISIVATTSIIADTTRTLAGPHASVTALMGPGVDPHLYKPSPGDLRTLSQATLILHNGLHLEGKMADALKKLGTRKSVVAVTDTIPRDRLRRVNDEGDIYDPHVWFDVQLWLLVAESIRAALSQIDPAHSAEYSTRLQSLQEQLTSLDRWTREQIAIIPPAQRILITAHDAFGYFGRAYGIDVKAIQGINTESEASLRTINDLVQVIVQRKVPAIFIENTISPKSIEALIAGAAAKGLKVSLGGQLFGDSLGDAGTDQEGYVGTFKHNVITIRDALSHPKIGVQR